jgi:hypothetical protein
MVSLESIISLRKELPQKDMILKISNHLLSSHRIQSISEMIKVSNKLNLISQMITFLANGPVKLKLHKLENTHSLLNQMMVQDYGSMDNKLSIIGDSMVLDKEKDQSL